MEGPFEALDGVISAESGYTGGHVDHVRYEQMHSGRTGHFEAVRVVYDPARVTYERLLEVFWRNVDPTQDDGQFCDRGPHYRSAIFVNGDEEREAATASRDRVARRLHARVVTEIRDASTFWLAEDYHQNYYRTHPTEYRRYRTGCGRDRRLRELWGDDAAH
jgi:peptide-methionine (S)-S-oxide reductase